MSITTIKDALLWCSVINYGILIVWVALSWRAGDLCFRLSGKPFRLSQDQFNAIQYGGIVVYKIGIVLFNVIPYIALRLVGSAS
jgi:hypothetical protein